MTFFCHCPATSPQNKAALSAVSIVNKPQKIFIAPLLSTLFVFLDKALT